MDLSTHNDWCPLTTPSLLWPLMGEEHSPHLGQHQDCDISTISDQLTRFFCLLRGLGDRHRYRPLIATFDSLSPLRYYAMSNYDTYTRTGPSWTIFDPSLLLLDCALSSYFWIRVALAVLDREPSWRHCAMSRWANLMSTCSTSSHDPLLLLGTNNYC